jgi:hypothetical protein
MTSGVMAAVTRRIPLRHIVAMRHFPPRRILCLTEEIVETPYLFGELDRNVGLSGYGAPAREAAGVGLHLRGQSENQGAQSISCSRFRTCRLTSLPSASAPASVHFFNQRDIA